MTGDPPQPRLCHIRKVADFDGYGFNLHAEKNKPGQFVGKIDPGSPAEIAGLKEGDREAAVIIAVLSLSLLSCPHPVFVMANLDDRKPFSVTNTTILFIVEVT